MIQPFVKECVAMPNNRMKKNTQQQIEETLKELRNKYALFVRRDTHGIKDELYLVSIKQLEPFFIKLAKESYEHGYQVARDRYREREKLSQSVK